MLNILGFLLQQLNFLFENGVAGYLLVFFFFFFFNVATTKGRSFLFIVVQISFFICIGLCTTND